MAIIDDFKTRFPGFDTTEVDTYLPAQIEIYPCFYGGLYEDCGAEIILNLLAHMLTQETSAGSGALKDEASKSVGSVSVSYGLATNSERGLWFRSTKYGMRYLLLTMHNRGGFFV